ncbi:MAG: metallophosphoesterase [Saprospiraceae bacterium]
MSFKNFLPAALFILPCLLMANGPITDNSRADADGPFVFYRGHHIVVKTLAYHDSTLVMKATKYLSRAEVNLECTLPATHDRFSFRLQDTLVVEPDLYALPDKMLVLSDIEGDFGALKMMLMGAKVMNAQFKWTFGAGHLVLVGDYFDRGLNVTECLWLIYKLETEAAAAGGKVHFILGNHEVLNMEGNTQYMRQKYVENVAMIEEDYIRWYDNNSELGRWLRTKNAVEKIGDYVFCHGGISPELARSGLSLHEVNTIGRHYLGKHHADIVNKDAQLVFDQRIGIFWYRGAAKEVLTEDEIRLILSYAGAKRMVIGHTMQNDVTGLYAGRVICVDLYHEENLRQGFVKTLYIEDGSCYGLDSRGEKSSIFSVVFSKK